MICYLNDLLCYSLIGLASNVAYSQTLGYEMRYELPISSILLLFDIGKQFSVRLSAA